jgi:hypothetical protein
LYATSATAETRVGFEAFLWEAQTVHDPAALSFFPNFARTDFAFMQFEEQAFTRSRKLRKQFVLINVHHEVL